MKKIKELRTKLGFTQEKLAEAVDLSVNYISEIENDRKKPSLKRLVSVLMDDESQKQDICPFFCNDKDYVKQTDSIDSVTKEILQLVLTIPMEERIKVLNYANDMKKLSSL
ncbi:MAG: helix-turn-helix domain-containing protein [Synergistaceae bacterium]|nr:helix-turn-helix domain-containing protein [Synergistaceae bacterium]